MVPFTYDVESTELTPEEVASFAVIVGYECNGHDQSRWSRMLESVRDVRSGNIVYHALKYRVSRLWRSG